VPTIPSQQPEANVNPPDSSSLLKKRKAPAGISDLYGTKHKQLVEPHSKKDKIQYATFLYRPNVGLPLLHEFINQNIYILIAREYINL